MPSVWALGAAVTSFSLKDVWSTVSQPEPTNKNINKLIWLHILNSWFHLQVHVPDSDYTKLMKLSFTPVNESITTEDNIQSSRTGCRLVILHIRYSIIQIVFETRGTVNRPQNHCETHLKPRIFCLFSFPLSLWSVFHRALKWDSQLCVISYPTNKTVMQHMDIS